MPFIGTVVFDKVMDPIYVRALAMDDGKHKALFITFDLCILPHPEEMLKLLTENTGIPEEYIFMAATHTHNVTPIGFNLYADNPENMRKCTLWYESMKQVVLDTVHQAEAELRPARIGYATGKSYINANRDEIKDGKTDLGINFERPSDKTLYLVRIEDTEGIAIALIVNYAVHAVVMNGYLVDGAAGLCGDLPGRTSSLLKKKMDGAVVLWTSGAAGDQNPRTMTAYGLEIKDGKPQIRSLGEKGGMILDFLSDEHVRDILRTNESLMCEDSDIDLFAAEEIVTCPGKDEKPDVSYTLRLLMMGDIAFEGISAEIVTTVGQAVREASPYRKTILVSHTSRYCGYVPDGWEYEHDAFEATGTPVKQGAALPAFIQGFKELFRKRRF